MNVRVHALLASLGVLWLLGLLAFMMNAPAAPRAEYIWLIASVALMSVASLSGLAIALATNTRRPAGLDPAEHYQLIARGHTATLATGMTDHFGDTTAELLRPSVYLHGKIYGRRDEDDHKLVGELQKAAPNPPGVPAWAFAKAAEEGPPGLFQSSDQKAQRPEPLDLEPVDAADQVASLFRQNGAREDDAGAP